MRTLFISGIAVLGLTLALAQGQSSTASIEGVVQNARTGEPVAGARVTLDRYVALPSPGAQILRGGAQPTAPIPSARSDGRGKFALVGLAPGEYRLTVKSNGYASQDYGQRTFPGQGTPIRLNAGQSIADLAIRMTPTGNVSGLMRNANGQPAPNVPVRLMQPAYNAAGQRTLSTVTYTRTNDRGEYRLYFVTPGRYYLAAGHLPGSPQETGAGTMNITGTSNEGSLVYGSLFYPGVDEVENAQTIQIESGADLHVRDMKVDRGGQYRIRGRVVDGATGRAPPAGSSINLSSPPNANTATFSSGWNYDQATGEFELNMIVPALYSVNATSQTGGPRGAPGLVPQRGSATVRVVDRDLDNVVVTIGAMNSFPVLGRIRVEGTGTLPGIGLRGLRPELIPLADNGSPAGQTVSIMQGVSPEGEFRIEGVAKGSYKVRLSGQTPAGYFVKAVTLGAVDAWSKPVALDDQPTAPLDILLGPATGQIEGTVLDASAKPVQIPEVVLVPDSNRDRPELFKTASVGRNGRFSLANVAPGQYRIFAWEALEPYAYFAPDVLKRYETEGKPVSVSESSRGEVEVRVITAAP